MTVDVVFLGTNNVGMEVYDWLCDRDGVDVRALLTEGSQLDLVVELEPDFAVAVGFRHVVPPDVLEAPSRGCINLHPGLLPHARGFNPNVWSIVEGLPAGVTIHYMEEAVDAGDVIATREVETRFDDTGRDLYERLESASYDLFTDTWPAVEAGEVESTPQPEGEGTMHYKRDFERLCELDPDAEYRAKDLLDVLRALTFPPFDNAHLEVDGETFYVEVDVTPESETADDPGFGALSSY